ncbi:MAG: hypothetical protein ACRCW4_14130 [Candidatus Neomicrothrix subdominans]
MSNATVSVLGANFAAAVAPWSTGGTERFVIPADGVYSFRLYMEAEQNNTASALPANMRLSLTMNYWTDATTILGFSNVQSDWSYVAPGQVNPSTSISIADTMKLTAGNEVSFLITHASAGPAASFSQTSFMNMENGFLVICRVA